MSPAGWRSGVLALSVLLLPLAASAEELELDLGGGVRLKLVQVPAGSFAQGSATAEQGHQPDEGKRRVSISKPFWLGKTKVSVGEFKRFVAESGYKTEAEKGTSGGFGLRGGDLVQDRAFTWRSPGFDQTDTHPVVLVTWADAAAFTRWLTTTTGREASLPTEAEWEYAARGGATTLFPWGDSERDAAAHARFADKPPGTRASSEGKPNGFGLLDVAGNAWEWTSDFHGPIGADDVTDPSQTQGVAWAHSDKPRRVLKGGSWHTKDVWKLRPAARNKATDGSRNADFGFRVRLSTAPPKPASPAGAVAAPGDAPQPRPVADRPSSPKPSSGCGFGLGTAVVGAVIALFSAIFLLARRGSGQAPKRGGVGSGGSHYPTRLAPDGFWVDAPRSAQGQSLRYRALVGGKQVDGVVVLGAGSTFVYTGRQPQHAVIAGVVSGGGSSPIHDEGPDSGPDSGPGYSALHSGGGQSSGWPSAY